MKKYIVQLYYYPGCCPEWITYIRKFDSTRLKVAISVEMEGETWNKVRLAAVKQVRSKPENLRVKDVRLYDPHWSLDSLPFIKKHLETTACCNDCEHLWYDAPGMDCPYPQFGCSKGHWDGSDEDGLLEPTDCKNFKRSE